MGYINENNEPEFTGQDCILYVDNVDMFFEIADEDFRKLSEDNVLVLNPVYTISNEEHSIVIKSEIPKFKILDT